MLKDAERVNTMRRTAEDHKTRGNNAFHQGKYKAAQEEYTAGLAVGLEDAKLNAILYANRSACLHGLHRYMDAIMDTARAVHCDATYLRAYQRRADALIAIGDHHAAMKDLETLQLMGCSDVAAKVCH